MYIYTMYFIGDINIHSTIELMRNMALTALYKTILIYDSIYFK